MAQIFAALSSPQSFMSAMGLPNGTTLTSAVVTDTTHDANNKKFLYTQGGFNLRCVSVAPITVQCNSPTIYMKMEAAAWIDTNNDSPATYGLSGQIHKIIKFIGVDGLCKFSIGHQPFSYYDTAAGYDVYVKPKSPTASRTFTLFSFAGANEHRPSKIVDAWSSPYSAVVADTLEIFIDLGTLGSRYVKFKVNGIQVAELLDADLPAGLTSIDKILVCDPASLSSTYYLGYVVGARISSLLVADSFTPDITIVGLVPTAFGAINNFAGALANITSPIQDSLFIATSAEIGQEVDLHFTFPTNLASVEKLDLYFQGKYVQAEGISAKFSLSLIDRTTLADITTPVIVTIPANQSDATYLTYKVTTWLQNIVTLQKLTAADLANAALKITIVGV